MFNLFDDISKIEQEQENTAADVIDEDAIEGEQSSNQNTTNINQLMESIQGQQEALTSITNTINELKQALNDMRAERKDENDN